MKTTKKDFELFKKECRKWIEFYGLRGWEFIYEHAPVKNGFAEHRYNTEERWVVIDFDTDWGKFEVSSYEIKQTAFHEITELWFGKIRILAKMRYVREDEIDEEIHVLVRTLENVIFKGD